MLPSSDALEALVDRAKHTAADLRKLKGAEVKRPELKERAAEVAREWLRNSQVVRAAGVCDQTKLDAYDDAMRDLLTAAGTRARASALLKKLLPFLDGAVTDVIVPVIQFEGSPRQVAARQIQAAITAPLLPDEMTYVEEAARCVTVQCYRAAIIMLWAGAIARLHGAIVSRGFGAFNQAVDAAIAKKGPPFNKIKEGAKLSSLPELQRSRDADVIIVGMELFGLDLQVYQELDRLLGVRNDAAHPGMGQPGALDVHQFATKIDAYIFQRVAP